MEITYDSKLDTKIYMYCNFRKDFFKKSSWVMY